MQYLTRIRGIIYTYKKSQSNSLKFVNFMVYYCHMKFSSSNLTFYKHILLLSTYKLQGKSLMRNWHSTNSGLSTVEQFASFFLTNTRMNLTFPPRLHKFSTQRQHSIWVSVHCSFQIWLREVMYKVYTGHYSSPPWSGNKTRLSDTSRS